MKFDKTKIIYNLDNLENLLFDSKKETSKEIATRIKHKIFTDKKIYNAFCKFPNSLLSIEKDLKTSKNSKNGYITGIQYLYNLKQFCSHAKIANCFRTCIVHTGNAIVFQNINIFRLVKALFKIQYPNEYLKLLKKDTEKLLRIAKKKNLKPCIRLNGTSDIEYEKDIDIFNYIKYYTIQHNIKYYDYTKKPLRNTQGFIDLTFSYSNESKYKKYVDIALAKKMRIAVVIHEKVIDKYVKQGFLYNNMVNGDDNDLTFLKPNNSTLYLKAKGFLQNSKDNNFMLVN